MELTRGSKSAITHARIPANYNITLNTTLFYTLAKNIIIVMSLREPESQAWNVSESHFPKGGTKIERLKFLLKYAILAPSSHNTQPWLFKIMGDNTIELYADRTRALALVDPVDRALTISCGAALSHLLLAIRHFGYAYELELFPDSNNNDLLSRIIVYDRKEPNSEESALFEAITKRRTNRLKFEDRVLEESLISRLRSVLVNDKEEAEGGGKVTVWFHIAREPDEKNSLADLIAEGDRIQLSDKRFRRELASWIHPNRSHSKDGMPGYAFGYNDIMSHMGPFVLRTFDIGKGQGAKDRELAAGSPTLAILGTRSDEPMDWLKTGMVLSRMLLAAQSENVWSSFLNQPIEVPELRPKVQELVKVEGKGFPQIMLRMGYGKEIKPTPRRPVEDVLL
ncbi:MAG: nitroreductase family protein [Nitrososphaeraceae archaeon]